MITTAYLYARVSTREQADDGASLAAQERRLREYAQFKGFDVVMLVDAGVTSKIPLGERPAGVKLFEAVAAGCPSGASNGRANGQAKGEARKPNLEGPDGPSVVVVATKLDRLFRNAAECLAVTENWGRMCVSLHVLNMGLDTSTPMGRMFLTIAAAFAELERDLIAERTREGLAQVMLEGVHVGRAPYGFHQDEGGKLVPVPAEQQVLSKILTWRREGYSFRGIAFLLSGTLTPRGATCWRPGAVHGIVESFNALPYEIRRGLEGQ